VRRGRAGSINIQARLGVLTLCVDDLDRAVQFYRALGLDTPGVVGQAFEHG
jgi:catechol 2,3-dioxygenase-like lactoylglutathione lyase family enzyme